MDTTETYIKMADCEEIQGLWELSDGDFIAQKGMYDKKYSVGVYPSCRILKGFQRIWLPTQDKLQEMHQWYPNVYGIAIAFSQYLQETQSSIGNYALNVGYLPSREQLWMAFVMKELHQKQWTGEKWEGVTANVR